MTVITVRMTKLEETFHFNPPLPPAKEIEILSFWCNVGFSRIITCEIVDPFSHYSKLGRGKIKPTRLVAYAGCSTKGTMSGRLICPPEKFPTVKAKESKDPINSMKISIERARRYKRLPDAFNRCTICLKIHH